MTIAVGDTVKLTRQVSIQHFKAADMTIIGKVAKIDMDNFVGVHHRPYFIEFPDRSGLWAYGLGEIKKWKVKA